MGYKTPFTNTITFTKTMGDMKGLRCYNLLPDDEFRLQLTTTTTSPLSIDVFETAHTRIQRLINENPIIVFSRPSCYMCDVMKRLFYSIGVYPIVIELEEDEIGELDSFHNHVDDGEEVSPVAFIGGNCVGGLESLVALHLSGQLVAKLVQIGALEGVVL